MKKIFSFILIACLVVPCAIMFSGCWLNMGSKMSFKANENVLESTNAIISDLTNNIYNASSLGTSTNYSVADIKEKNANFNYYVEAGTLENAEDVESITIGGTTFINEQTFNLSIGNSNFINDKCYYVEDNKIYVAGPIIAFETVNNSKIKINDSEFDFNLNKTVNESKFTNAEFSSGSTNTIKDQDGSFNIEFKDAKSYLKLYYEGATANDIVLTKKVINNSGNSNINGVANYGLTKVENENNNPVGLYPIGYSKDALTENCYTWYNDATMNYQAYIIDKGIVSTTLNFDIVISE